MKKNILIFGLIAGLVVMIPLFYIAYRMITLGASCDMEQGMVIGYTSMLIAFSMVFVGIRNYRNKFNNGLISFGKAFTIGALISLIASTVYVGTWLVIYYNYLPDFAEVYSASQIEQLKASGATEAELAAKTKEMAEFAEMYHNPFFNALMTYMEILPVGLLVTLISSLILKRKQKPEVATT